MIPYVLDENKPLSTLVTATNNGVGRLAECQSFIVHEALNGEYTAKMEVPIVAYNSGLLHNNGIIKCKADSQTDFQLFRIHTFSKSLKDGMIVCNMNHISYDLQKIVGRFNGNAANSPSNFITVMNNNVIGTNPFTITTDITGGGLVSLLYPRTFKDCLMGDENSFFTNWGGQITRDNLNVIINSRRGEDKTGIVVRYGKNVLDARMEKNISNIYTGIIAYAFTPDFGTAIVDQPIQVVASDYPMYKIVDFSSKASSFENYASNPLSYVHQWALAYVQENDITTPEVNIAVDFLSLEKIGEYEHIKQLQTINLGDTVTVKVEPLGMNLTADCIEREYDGLAERHTKIQLGNYTQGLTTTLMDINKKTTAELNYIKKAYAKTATSNSNGLMSASDKAKLDSL